MSEKLLGNHFSHDIHKVIAISVMAAITEDLAIHDAWLPVGQFREYLHEKYIYDNYLQFNTKKLIG